MTTDSALFDLESLGLPPDAVKPSRSSPNFTLRLKVIEHPKFTAVVREVARLHRRGVEAGVAEGRLLVAQTGSGKSTLVKFYARRFPAHVVDGITKIPVVCVNTPDSPTVKSLAVSILTALGDPAASSGSAKDMSGRIANFFKECGVQLLFLDEFHHFFDGHRASECRNVANWLKTLIDRVEVPVILVGLPKSIRVTGMNHELRRRFASPLYLEPFEFTTARDKAEFRSVLKKIQQAIPVDTVSLWDVEVAKRFYYASHGLIDYVVKVVDDAVSRGGYGLNGAITLDDYAAAFRRTVWSSAPDDLNPFMADAKLRPLTNALEPFDVFDDLANYDPTSARPAGPRRS